MVQKMRKHRSIKSVKYMIHFIVTIVIIKTCVESSQVEALKETLQDRNNLLNSGLQSNDRYGASPKLNKTNYKKKYGFHHGFDGYRENEPILMTQQKETGNNEKLKRNSFSFGQIDNEIEYPTFKKEKDDADGFSQYHSFQISRKNYSKNRNHLTSKKFDQFKGKYKRFKRNASAFAKYVPLNSLTLSRISQLKPGNGATVGGSPSNSSTDHKKDQAKTPYEDSDIKNTTKMKGNKNSLVPWWKQFPKKTKNKNKQILNELNKITDSLPEWPWMNSLSKSKAKKKNAADTTNGSVDSTRKSQDAPKKIGTTNKESVLKDQNNSPQDSKKKVQDIPTLSSLMYLVKDKSEMSTRPKNKESMPMGNDSTEGIEDNGIKNFNDQSPLSVTTLSTTQPESDFKYPDDLLSSASNKQHYTNDFEGGKHAVKGNGFISTIKRNDVENSPEEYDRIIKNTEASKGQGTSLVQSNVIRITSRYPANINNNVKTESPTNLKTIQGELIETGGGASSYGFFKRKEEDSDTQGIYTLDQTTLIENLENITEDLTTQRSQTSENSGRFSSSTSNEYPEWFLTAFAVAEPEIFALASTESSVPPSLVFETTQGPLYEPRIPSSKTNIASSNSDSAVRSSSFLSINNLLDQGEYDKEEQSLKFKNRPLHINRVTFGNSPNLATTNDENGETITRPPNYSAAVPVQWSQIRPNNPTNEVPKQQMSQEGSELDIEVRNYSQSDPLGIFPTRNDTEEFVGQGSVDIRDKYPQLFLANHLAQLKDDEHYGNGKEQQNSNTSDYFQYHLTDEEKRQTLNKIIGLVANAPLKNQTFYESSSSPSDAIWSPEISSDTSLVQLFKKPKPSKVDDYNIIQVKYNKDDQKENNMVRNVIAGGMKTSKEKVPIMKTQPLEATKTDDNETGMFVNGVYRPSTLSAEDLKSSFKPISADADDHIDIRTSSKVPNSSSSNNIFSSSPAEKNNEEKLPYKQIFKKVSDASASKGESLITSSTWSAPIINSSPIPINLFVPKSEQNSVFDDDDHIINDFQQSESQKIYSPYVQPRPGGPGHVIGQITESKEDKNLSVLTSKLNQLININKSMMETLHHQLSVQSAVLQQLIRLGKFMENGFKIINSNLPTSDDITHS